MDNGSIAMSAPQVRDMLKGSFSRICKPIVIGKIERPAPVQYFRPPSLSSLRKDATRHDGLSYVPQVKASPVHVFVRDESGEKIKVSCPYKKVGAELRVMEPWHYGCYAREGVHNDPLQYAVKGVVAYAATRGVDDRTGCVRLHLCNPQRMMPKYLSRLFLRVEAIHVARLHDVDDAGAQLEGFADVTAYRRGFQRFNGVRNWENNPFVWRMDFSIIDRSEDVYEYQEFLRLVKTYGEEV